MLGEFDRSPVDINHARHAPRPRLQRVQLGFGEYDALHPHDEFGKRVDVHTDCLTAGRKSFYEACPTTNMRIKNEISWHCECLDRSARKYRTKASRIFIESMRQALHRLGIARACDQSLLRGR